MAITRDVGDTLTPHVTLVSTSLVTKGTVKALWAHLKAGRIAPTPIELGEMPDDATDDMQRVAELLAELIGSARAAGLKCPIPCSTGFCAAEMGWKGQSGRNRASRTLRALQRAKVIESPGSLAPQNGQPRGTKLFCEPVGLSTFGDPQTPVDLGISPSLDDAVYSQALLVESAIDEPAAEVVFQTSMDGAHATVRQEVRMVAAGNETAVSRSFGHAANASATGGGEIADEGQLSLLNNSTRPLMFDLELQR